MTQTALAVTTVQQIAKQFEYEENFVQTVKDTIAKDATDNELRLFLQTAKRTGLDPFARQIFCVKRYSGGKEVMSVQISIDGFRAIADRTNKYVPSVEPTYTFDKNGNLESATAYIKKFAGGCWHEIAATAFYAEYVQTTTKDGQKRPNAMWAKMPRLMLAKCAESLCLRKAFPAELSGLYTSEEMGTEESELETIPQTRTEPKPAPKQIQEPKTIEAETVLTDEETAMRNEIETALRCSDIQPATMLKKFDACQTTTRRVDCLKACLNVAVTQGLGGQDWDMNEQNQYLEQFGLEEGLSAATVEQLRAIFTDMKDSGMVICK